MDFLTQPLELSWLPDANITVWKTANRIEGTVTVGPYACRFTSSEPASLIERKAEYTREALVRVLLQTDLRAKREVLNAMRSLKQLGRQLQNQIFGNSAAYDFLKTNTNRNKRRYALIALDATNVCLPWELLYEGDDTGDFYGFLGAKAVIYRIIHSANNHGDEIAHQDKPTVGLFPYKNLDYSTAEEVPFFERLNTENRISLKTWNTTETDWFNASREFLNFWNHNFHLAHFACHAGKEDSRNESHLLLADGMRVTLGNLRDLFERDPLPNNPLLVLNACSTAGDASKTHTSVVDTFVRMGARGIVSTETDIPDSLAPLFSRTFYPYFLPPRKRRRSDLSPLLCDCLHKTRIDLWQKFTSPLGLLYSLHGSPATHFVRSAVESLT